MPSQATHFLPALKPPLQPRSPVPTDQLADLTKLQDLMAPCKAADSFHLNISCFSFIPPSQTISSQRATRERDRQQQDGLCWRPSSDAMLSAGAAGRAGLTEITAASTPADLKAGLKQRGAGLRGRCKHGRCRAQPPALLTDSPLLCFNAAGWNQLPLSQREG